MLLGTSLIGSEPAVITGQLDHHPRIDHRDAEPGVLHRRDYSRRRTRLATGPDRRCRDRGPGGRTSLQELSSCQHGNRLPLSVDDIIPIFLTQLETKKSR